jgi:hypothetical protein
VSERNRPMLDYAGSAPRERAQFNRLDLLQVLIVAVAILTVLALALAHLL